MRFRKRLSSTRSIHSMQRATGKPPSRLSVESRPCAKSASGWTCRTRHSGVQLHLRSSRTPRRYHFRTSRFMWTTTVVILTADLSSSTNTSCHAWPGRPRLQCPLPRSTAPARLPTAESAVSEAAEWTGRAGSRKWLVPRRRVLLRPHGTVTL